MKKKIKDLTVEEMGKICSKHTQGGFVHCENSKCPLWFANSCIKGFVEKIQYIEKEVESMNKELTLQDKLRLLRFGKVENHYLENLYFDEIEKALKELEYIETTTDSVLREDISMKLKALEIISQNFRLVGNCLHAKNKYVESGWVFVKEIEDEEELEAWKEVLL